VAGLERVASQQTIGTSSATRRRRRETDVPTTADGRAAQHRLASSHPHLKGDHALSEMYESLDYEIVENQLYRDEESEPQYQVGILFGYYGKVEFVAQKLVFVMKIFKAWIFSF
jgi:hypothetical protein